MKILFLVSIFLVPVLIILLVLLNLRLKRYRKSYRAAKRDVNKMLKIFEKVRYGQLYSRVENLSNKTLEDSINRLIETLNDRESMIKEYQINLSEKNASLEKYIEGEKKLQKFKEDFVATLTHDLKVPIIAELNALDFLLSGRFGELNEKQIEALKLMKGSNEELIELSETLLETYKLENSSLVLNLQKSDINSFVSDIVEEMRIIASNNSRELIFAPIDFNFEVYIDKLQMKRVLKNLIINAISFSTFDTQIFISIEKSDNTLLIKVKNFGKGISKDELELVFKKYYSSVKKFRKIGTGLGLYLSNQIVKAHKGSLIVDSIEDDTTTFTVSIPV